MKQVVLQNTSVEITPLNQELYSDFQIQELENRFETAWLVCGVDCPNLEKIEIPIDKTVKS